MFLVRQSLYNPSFCSHSTRTASYRFFVKLSVLVSFIWCCKNVFSFVLRCFSITGDSYFECAEKKRNSVFVSVLKRLWCNADTQVFLAFSSIMVNLHSQVFVFFFQYMHLFCVGTMYLIYYCNYCSSTQAPYSHQITGSSVRM